MKPPSAEMVAVLRFLRELLLRRGGYEMHGVRGWAGLQQINDRAAVAGAGEVLRMALRKKLVDRADARVPDVGAPYFIYRISQGGLAELVRLEGGGDTPKIQKPRPGVGKRRAYLPSGMVAALDAMRAARHQPGNRDRIPGQPEWRTSLELTNWLKAESERTGEPRVFFPDELQRLVRYGLAERRADDAGDLIYRITESGVLLEPLKWRGSS